MNNSKITGGNIRLRRLTAISLFCALAYICVFLIRFKVSFLTFDLKDAIMAIGAMYFGPVTALAMPIVVSIIEFLTISDTGIYGLIMNFLSSASFCFVSSIIYKFRKNIFGAIVALVSAVVITTGVMMSANLVVTPYFMGVTSSDVSKMIPTLLLPFNLIKGIVNASVVMILYKYFSAVLKAGGVITATSSSSASVSVNNKSRIILTIISFLILAAALAVLFVILNATID